MGQKGSASLEDKKIISSINKTFLIFYFILFINLLDSEVFDKFERTTDTLAIDSTLRIDTNIYKSMVNC